MQQSSFSASMRAASGRLAFWSTLLLASGFTLIGGDRLARAQDDIFEQDDSLELGGDDATEDDFGPAADETDAAGSDADASELEPAGDESSYDTSGYESDYESDYEEEPAPAPAPADSAAASPSSASGSAEASFSIGGDADGAKAEASAETEEDQHGPIMVRLGVGAGYGLAEQAARVDLSFEGVSALGHAAVGFALADRLAIQVEGAATVLPTASMSTAQRNRTIDIDGDSSVMAYMVGAGLTHWLVPGDFYLSASVGPAWARFEHGDLELGKPKMGVGVKVDVGKTFWLLPQLGLSVGLYLNYMSIPDASGEDTFVIPGDCNPDQEACKIDTFGHRFGVTNVGITASAVYF